MEFIDRIKNILKSNEDSFFPAPINTTKEYKDNISYENPFSSPMTESSYASILFQNDSVDTVAEACSCCWDKRIPDEYEKRIDYIGRRCKTGHTSILEHSNLIIGVFVNKDLTDDLTEFLSSNRYLHTAVKNSYKTPGAKYLILGGSWRGFIDIFYNISSVENKVLGLVKSKLYSAIPKQVMYSVITDGFMNEDNFSIYMDPPKEEVTLEFDGKEYNCYTYHRNLKPRKDIDSSYERFITPINMDNILTINSIINKFIEEENRPKYDYFDKYELGDFATITLCFKDMSRTATHQLVRHRNGITQESQRYVDYSKHGFINPLDYSAEKYKESDPTNATYNFNGERLTLNQLSNKLMSYYEVLVNDKNAPLHKEDARGFLPSNVACAKLYMTFNFRTFAKFLELRDHIAAQSEIRAFAHACSIWFNSLWDESLNMHLLGFLTSKYSIALKKASYMENIKEE